MTETRITEVADGMHELSTYLAEIDFGVRPHSRCRVDPLHRVRPRRESARITGGATLAAADLRVTLS